MGSPEEGKAYKEKFLDGTLRFLDMTPLDGDRISYQTFGRSGSTFLRKYLELITGIPTGSEMNLGSPMTFQMSGMIGEQVADDSIWITKTHHPFPRFRCLNFHTNKIIVCVRNPFDVLISFMNFFSTFSHSKDIENKPELENPEFFDYFMRFTVK